MFKLGIIFCDEKLDKEGKHVRINKNYVFSCWE